MRVIGLVTCDIQQIQVAALPQVSPYTFMGLQKCIEAVGPRDRSARGGFRIRDGAIPGGIKRDDLLDFSAVARRDVKDDVVADTGRFLDEALVNRDIEPAYSYVHPRGLCDPQL